MVKKDTSLSEYYRKSASIIKVVRFAVLLAFVLFSVYCIGFFRDNLTMENLKYLWQQIKTQGVDNTPAEAEISFSSDDSSQYLLMNNDLAMVSNTSVKSVSFSGDELYSHDYAYSHAAAVQDGNMLLVYDIDGNNLSLYNTVAKVLNTRFEEEIKVADVNSLGYFAVVNGAQTYSSGVMVFEPVKNRGGVTGELNPIFRSLLGNKQVTSLSLNSNGSKIAYAAIDNMDGAYVSDIYVYDTTTPSENPEPAASVSLSDELVLKIGYVSNDSVIYALTYGKFLCYDKNLKLIGSKSFSGKNAKLFKEFDNCFVVAQSNNLSGSSMTLHAYNYNADTLFELKTEDKITDIALSGNTLYVLYRDKLCVYSVSGSGVKIKAEMPLEVQYKSVLADKNDRFILISTTRAKRNSLESILNNYPVSK